MAPIASPRSVGAEKRSLRSDEVTASSAAHVACTVPTLAAVTFVVIGTLLTASSFWPASEAASAVLRKHDVKLHQVFSIVENIEVPGRASRAGGVRSSA